MPGPPAANHRADLVAALIAQRHGGPHQIRPFAAGCVRTVAEPAGRPEGRLPALHRRRFGHRAADQKRASGRAATARRSLRRPGIAAASNNRQLLN